MKATNNARKGAIICVAIVIIALIMILIVNSVPDGETGTLNSANKLMSYVGTSNGTVEMPMWKVVCYIIVGILALLEIIINFVMCRCHNCGRHIWYMNIFMMYCPYCSKSLDVTKE